MEDADDVGESFERDEESVSLSFMSNDLFICVLTLDGNFSKQCLHTGFESKSQNFVLED